RLTQGLGVAPCVTVGRWSAPPPAVPERSVPVSEPSAPRCPEVGHASRTGDSPHPPVSAPRGRVHAARAGPSRVHSGTLIMASATLAASAARHNTSALEARSMRGRRRNAEGAHVAETVSKAHDLPLGFRVVSSDVRIHSVGRFHMGGGAYFVW